MRLQSLNSTNSYIISILYKLTVTVNITVKNTDFFPRISAIVQIYAELQK